MFSEELRLILFSPTLVYLPSGSTIHAFKVADRSWLLSMVRRVFKVSDVAYFALSRVASFTFTEMPATSKGYITVMSSEFGVDSWAFIKYVPAVIVDGKTKLFVTVSKKTNVSS